MLENEDMGSREAFCLLPWVGEMCWAGSVRGELTSHPSWGAQSQMPSWGLGGEEVTVVALVYSHQGYLGIKEAVPNLSGS